MIGYLYTPFRWWRQSRSAFWARPRPSFQTAMARWTTEKVWVTLPTNHPGVVTSVWIFIPSMNFQAFWKFLFVFFCWGVVNTWQDGGVFSVHFLSSPTLQLLLQLLSCRDHSLAPLRNDSETSHPKIKQAIFVAFKTYQHFLNHFIWLTPISNK